MRRTALPLYLAFGSSRTWLALLLRHRGVSPRFAHRSVAITCLTALLRLNS